MTRLEATIWLGFWVSALIVIACWPAYTAWRKRRER